MDMEKELEKLKATEKSQGENEKKKPWEVLKEQKENIFNKLKENPEILDIKMLSPEVIYPNMERYEVNGMNNLMLSTVAAEKKYADNTWVMSETIENAKYTTPEGEKKQTFFIKKGEKPTKIGIEVKERNVQDPFTGSWYKEKLDKPYIKNVNVYNLSQFSFAKDIYPKKTYMENKKKDSITLSPEKVEELKRNTFESKLEKFFIEQKFNIKNGNKIEPINKEELKKDMENTRTHEGKLHEDAYRMEFFPEKSMFAAKKTIENSKIEKNIGKKEKEKKGEKER